MRKKRISIRRRSGKIGFLGKGMRVPASEKSEIVYSLSARLDEEAVGLADADLEAYREDVKIEPRVLRRFLTKRPKAVVRPESGEPSIRPTLISCRPVSSSSSFFVRLSSILA